MNVEFLSFLGISLFYIMIQDKVMVLNYLGRFGDYYRVVWDWIRENLSKVIRDEEDWEGAWTTHSIIMLNVACYVLSLAIGYEAIVGDFSFIPAKAAETWRWISHMFLHANIPVEIAPFSVHLLYNMIFLYVFGDNVEKWLERFKLVKLNTELNVYLGLYLIFGVIAAVVQATVIGWGSMVAMIGASGAISGVLGMYLVLFPESKVVVAGRETLPSSVYLILWFLSQFAVSDATVAVMAHVGGFISGVLAGWVLKRVSGE